MKKILACLLACIFAIFGLAACGDDSESEEVTFDYDYDLTEYITIGEYKGIEYTPETLVVADGDTVSVDYVGKIDGEEFEGGTGTNDSLQIGSGTFIDGFESGLIGMTVGETRDLSLTFPEDYSSTDLAGKPVVFTATVTAINGYTDSLDLDKAVIWQEFFDSCEVKKYPEKELNYMIEQQKEYYESLASAYGMEYEDVLSSMGYTEDEFDEEIEEYSKSMVAQDMALYALVREVGLEADDESREYARNQLLDSYGVSTEDEFKEATGYDFSDETVENSVEMTALLQKALDYLYENAVVVENVEE